MLARVAVLGLVFTALIGGAGYLLGLALQSREPAHADLERPAAIAQSAPEAIAPAHQSVFVDSDIALGWSWEAGLEANQFYALRLWAEDRPHQEVWTQEDELSVKQTIDSFSIDFGAFHWQVAVVNVDADGAYAGMGSDWSAPRTLQRLRRLPIAATAYSEMSAAARHFHDQGLDATALIDSVHRFVAEHSLLEEQLSYAPDYSDALELMFNYAQGATEQRPQLLCDGRATAMLTLLRELGIESRLVFLYQSLPGWLNQHTVLEVFHPGLQRWQTHDVAAEFTFANVTSGARVSAARILYGPPDDLVGCPIAGGDCTVELMLSRLGYFSALRYGFTFEVWANPDRFDLSQRFEGQDNMNLAEYIGDGDPRRVTVRIGVWP